MPFLIVLGVFCLYLYLVQEGRIPHPNRYKSKFDPRLLSDYDLKLTIDNKLREYLPISEQNLIREYWQELIDLGIPAIDQYYRVMGMINLAKEKGREESSAG
jgi:hypothetical protein